MATASVGLLARKERIAGDKKDPKQLTVTKETTAHTSKLARSDRRRAIRYRHTAAETLRRSRKQRKVSNSTAMLLAAH
jgi:hypothetical protein